MASKAKCKSCGSTDVEVDNARGDAVCTSCGSVLEDNLIVSEVQFEDVSQRSAVLGQFVSSETTGGAVTFGYGKFQVGPGSESREITVRRGKKGIGLLCDQLHLSSHYVETALNFFKLALNRHLTKGRRNTHIYAACVYITCRTNGTSHLLIDISDILQICCYELGRTYLRLSQALCINIPSIDPCLYVMRFASKLEFGDKTHDVATTALRVVQRMKKDSIHSGRRPTGLCGAALLIASRMHEFHRTIMDIVKIVKIHESTLRKRLIEFADTPSSSLTLDEFMSVDLEAEQDPPAFKLSRKRDKERIQQIGDHELNSLQRQIDAYLEKDVQKHAMRLKYTTVCTEEELTNELHFEKSVFGKPITTATAKIVNVTEGIKPNIDAICTPSPVKANSVNCSKVESMEELSLEGLDDDEINGYIMTTDEARSKNQVWVQLNAEYLEGTNSSSARIVKEPADGKLQKKRKRNLKKNISPSITAEEAIEKMLHEKKLSNKINYDILKSLSENENCSVANVQIL
uniref:B-related factor 1 n=1 Tax=Tabanus bromius TaxID=304241 RepID=A0A0K8TND5_TABBR